MRLIGRLYRQARRSGRGTDAMQVALDAYRALYPYVSEAEARETVRMFIRASSESGRIWTDG